MSLDPPGTFERMIAERTATVLIVDDHAGFRPFAHTLLEADGWNVVGEAADAAEAVKAVADLHPDLVLLDIQLPDRSGFDIADELAGEQSPPRVVLMSSREASAYGDRLRNAPVAGFLPKHELSGETLAGLFNGEAQTSV